MSESKEFQGKNLDEAIEAACKHYDLKRDKLEIEIVSGGSSGIFGLVGVKKAIVRAKPRGSFKAAEPAERPRRESASRGSDSRAAASPVDRPAEQSGVEAPAAPDRAAPDGVAPNGAVTNGAVTNGAVTNGAVTDGVPRAAADSAEGQGGEPRRSERSRRGRGRGERSGERSAERTGERSAERTGERGGKRSEKPAEPQAERGPSTRSRRERPRREADQQRPPRREPREPREDEESGAPQGIAHLDQAKLEAVAREVTQKLLLPLVENAQVSVELLADRVCVKIEDPENTGLLIGREGQTLASIQYLVNRLVSKRMDASVRVQIDAGDYRENQDERLRQIARHLADKTTATGRTQSTRPMSSYHRRVVHLTLQDDEFVFTRSKGEGSMKRVLIMPKRKGKDGELVEPADAENPVEYTAEAQARDFNEPTGE